MGPRCIICGVKIYDKDRKEHEIVRIAKIRHDDSIRFTKAGRTIDDFVSIFRTYEVHIPCWKRERESTKFSVWGLSPFFSIGNLRSGEPV